MNTILNSTLYMRDGVWCISAFVIENNAKKRIRFSTGFKVGAMEKQDEAYLFLKENAKELTKLYLSGHKDKFKKAYEKYKRKGTKLFKSVAKDFIKEAEQGLKEKSKMALIERLRPVLGFFEWHNITDINKDEIEKFFDFLDAKNLSVTTKRHYAKALNRVLNYAYENEMIKKNHFKLRKWREEKEEITTFSECEIALLLKEASGEIGTYLKIALLCGARTGEILALQWKHIDFENHKIHITQSISEQGLSTPKTANSKRSIDLLEPLEKYLKALKNTLKTNDEDFIFKGVLKPYIKNFHKSYLRVQYIALLARLNIPFRPIYNTRHSFASFMLSKGENLMWVSWMLGHKNTQITLNFYAKYIPSGTHARFLDSFLGGAL